MLSQGQAWELAFDAAFAEAGGEVLGGGSRSTGRSMTDEEREAEKQRIQGMVNTFAKKAVRGCNCVYISEGNGERAPALCRP